VLTVLYLWLRFCGYVLHPLQACSRLLALLWNPPRQPQHVVRVAGVAGNRDTIAQCLRPRGNVDVITNKAREVKSQ